MTAQVDWSVPKLDLFGDQYSKTLFVFDPPIGQEWFFWDAKNHRKRSVRMARIRHLAEIAMGLEVQFVCCSNCGKRVSQFVTVRGGEMLVVRAWVECPECIEKNRSL